MELSSGSVRDIALVTPLAASRQPEPAGQESKECRLCFESIGEDFIAPCRCSGTSRWVHRQCLNQWRSSGTNRRAFDHCCECGYAYRLILARQESDEETIRQRQRIVVGQMLRHCLLTTALIQMWLLLVALIIHSCDPRESIAKAMHLPWDELPPPGDNSWFDRMRYDKASYYLAAVILTLFLIGFFGCTLMCTAMCGNWTSSFTWLDNFIFWMDCRMCTTACLDCTNTNALSCCECGSCNCNCDVSALACEGDSGLLGCGALLVVALITIAVFGLVIVTVLLVMAGQRAMTKILEVRELRVLASDYMVEDLSSCNPPVNFPARPEPEVPLPAPGGIVASAPPQQDLEAGEDGTLFGPVTDPAVQRSLLRDMQALYGAGI